MARAIVIFESMFLDLVQMSDISPLMIMARHGGCHLALGTVLVAIPGVATQPSAVPYWIQDDITAHNATEVGYGYSEFMQIAVIVQWSLDAPSWAKMSLRKSCFLVVL